MTPSDSVDEDDHPCELSVDEAESRTGQVYQCRYSNDPNMDGCKQVATIYSKGASKSMKGWHRVCQFCWEWLVANKSLSPTEFSHDLDDEDE